jgi:hypothetical protein
VFAQHPQQGCFGVYVYRLFFAVYRQVDGRHVMRINAFEYVR